MSELKRDEIYKCMQCGCAIRIVSAPQNASMQKSTEPMSCPACHASMERTM